MTLPAPRVNAPRRTDHTAIQAHVEGLSDAAVIDGLRLVLVAFPTAPHLKGSVTRNQKALELLEARKSKRRITKARDFLHSLANKEESIMLLEVG